ncbi:hypothetical protein [Adlercreutzia caecimuris]|uniref:hypothetical protein n=2 Tax=Adlercreutzia caecimuris TaxID=671266 RepID=UPI00272C6509|nr:hypothetical protein [Adlercreutzia caecimuris]
MSPHFGKMTVLPYISIANAIRGQNGELREYKPCEMAQAIRDLEWEKSSKAYALLMYLSDGETK